MGKAARPLNERIADADQRGNNWLARGNEYSEAGNKKKAEECYAKGQAWMDKSNWLQEQVHIQRYRNGIKRIAKMAAEDENWRISTAANALLE